MEEWTLKLKTFSPADDSFAAMAVGNRKADLAHDAAYAHALVMAMEELRPKVGYAMWEFAIPMITNRADELMREWGYHD